jgi:hypothetical protein
MTVFSTFQDIYSGCCTVAARSLRSLMSEDGTEPSHRYTTICTRDPREQISN